ncbi:MAG: hypothetical protein IT385_26470 [Deltaproteobacteria bacterium]|nr:hypothetical protein [Deltaproteobacteria bacterium]
MLTRLAVILTLVCVAACGGDDDTAASFVVTDRGTGEPVATSFAWLRPGYFAVRPALGEVEPAGSAAVMRTVTTPGGTGVVLTAAGHELSLLRWAWVLEETKAGLVAHRSGDRLLDPPWLVVPASPRDGMRWDIRDGGGHVVAQGAIAVRPEVHPTLGTIDVLDVTIDVDRTRAPGQGDLVWTEGNTPAWRMLVNRPADSHPCKKVGSILGALLPTNPLAHDGGALRWRLTATRGLWADAALVPTATGPLPAPARATPTRLSPRALEAGVHPAGNAWNVTRVEGDPRFEAPARVDLSGFEWGSGNDGSTPCQPGEGYSRRDRQSRCALIDAAGALTPEGGAGFREGCGDATHFETTDDGVPARVPTVAGFALEDRVHPYAIPWADTADRGWLHGAFLGLFRGADGEVRGLSAARLPGPDGAYGPTVPVDDGTITHEAPVATRPEHMERGLDPDYPAVGHVYATIGNFDPEAHELDQTGTRIAAPPISHIRRVAVTRPEVEGEPLPFVVDAFPWLGAGHLARGLVPGARASGHVDDGAIAAYFPEPLTIVRHADGRRTVFAVELEGAVRELDVGPGGLRWRSLGRPAIPDAHVPVGAWREGDRLVVLTQRGASTFYDATYVRASGAALWDMPVSEGAWEPLPGHLFPGVDLDGEGRVVCAPPGATLDATSVSLVEDWSSDLTTKKLDVSSRCVIALADTGTRDIAALVRDGGPITRPPLGVRFEHPAVGPVVAVGPARLVELGGRLRVPAATWDALAEGPLVGAATGDYASLATPLPRALRDAFGYDAEVHPEASGGHWVVPRKLTCGPDLEGDEGVCATAYHLPATGAARAVPIPTVAPAGWLGAGLPWPLTAVPAWDRGLYLAPNLYLAPDGAVVVGAFGGAVREIGTLAGVTAPEGPRPPPGLDDRMFVDHGPPAPAPPGVALDGFVIVVGEGEFGPLTATFGLDPWRGVTRPLVVPPDAVQLFERFGGPLDDALAALEITLAPGRATFVRRAANTTVAFATYQTDAFGRAVELLAAGVSTGGLGAPDPRAVPAPSCGCDPDTELCQAGQCACAPEHARVGEACVPLLGGSYLPAPSCAAIQARYGATPATAYVDPDGTYPSGITRASSTLPSHGTIRATCAADGLTEQRPRDPQVGDLDDLRTLHGAFRISPPSTLRDLAGDTLVDVRLENRDTPQQRLFVRVRSEELDLGLVPPTFDLMDLAAYAMTRDAGGRLCVLRDGFELACRELPDSPLVFGAPFVPTAVATAGVLCPPDGHDYGAGLCACAPLSCEAAAHACAEASDGCFDTHACGACDPGLVCEHARCLCVPDPDERDPTTDADDAYYLKLGLDGEAMARTASGFTLDDPEDVDWFQLPSADAAFMTPNELYIRIRSEAAAPITLTVGTAGCATACAAGATEVQAPWPSGATSVGCRASGVGEVTVVFRVACDPNTLDAERGLYYARVEAAPDRVEACLTYTIEAETRAAPTFP